MSGEETQKEARPPRIDEVARIAGVAPITVSRALRNPEKVTEETRRRVMEAVEQTGYAPNLLASNLRSGRSSIVAAFVSNLANPEFARAIQGVADVLEPHGYQLLVGQTSYSYEKETSMIQTLLAFRPAAALFTGVIELEGNRDFLRQLRIPIMETWAYPQDPIDMLVGFSNFDGGRLVGEHLGERGYRSCAYVGRGGGRGALRLQGFREGLAKHGRLPVAEVAIDGTYGMAEGRAALVDLLGRGTVPDAVFFGNDLLAVGAMFEARRRGLKVPGDIAIAGFGDIEIAGELMLTTIRIDGYDIGHRAGVMLLKRLGGDAPERAVELVDLGLVVREST